MLAVLPLLLILAPFGGLGFLVHALWFVLIAAVVLWLIGFLLMGARSGRHGFQWRSTTPAEGSPEWELE
jgi:hypothetical protein